MKGDGRVFQLYRKGEPLRFWHIGYYFDGREIRESARTTDRKEAEALLADRILARKTGRMYDRVSGKVFKYGRHGHGGVYFLQAKSGGPIKIGVARNVAQRVVDVQVSTPEELVCLGVTIGAGRNEERRLHRYFADSWIRGEWFHPTDDVLKWIERCTTKIPARVTAERSPVAVKAGLVVFRGETQTGE